MVEGRERVDDRREGRHRVRVLREPVVEALDVFVQQCVLADLAAELVSLRLRGQLAVDEEPRRFEERRVLLVGDVVDVVAAVAEDANLAVDERDRRLGGAGVHVAVVECDESGLRAQLRDVDGAFAFGPTHDGELDLLAVPSEYCGRFGHVDSLVLVIPTLNLPMSGVGPALSRLYRRAPAWIR